MPKVDMPLMCSTPYGLYFIEKETVHTFPKWDNRVDSFRCSDSMGNDIRKRGPVLVRSRTHKFSLQNDPLKKPLGLLEIPLSQEHLKRSFPIFVIHKFRS